MALQGRKILLGVCGSIAAYKSALLVRLLIKAGAEVQVILTASASAFVTPLTLGTLSKNPVLTGFLKNEAAGEWHNHVHLGLWADALVIAPLVLTPSGTWPMASATRSSMPCTFLPAVLCFWPPPWT